MKHIEVPKNLLSPQYILSGGSVLPIYPFQRLLDELSEIEKITINEVVMEEEEVDYWRRKRQFLLAHKWIRPTPKFMELNTEDVKRELANLHQLTLEVTDACNLKCKYCGYGEFYDNHDERTDQYMNPTAIEKLIDYLIDLWNSPLNCSHGRIIYISFYGGEPLMNMPFIERIISYVDRQKLLHNRVEYSMTTNAVLLRRYSSYLSSHRIKLLISLDGGEENNGYRVFPVDKPSFGLVTKNIDYLKSYHPEYFEECVNFNSVLHNKNSVSNIYQYIKDTYGKVPSIGELNNSGIKEEKETEFFSTYRNASESLYQAEDYKRIKEDMFTQLGEVMEIGLFLLKYSGNVFHGYNDFFTSDVIVKRTPTGTCKPFSKKMFITVNGKVLTCERIGHQFGVGEISSESINICCKSIADKYNNYYDRMKALCKHCYNIDNCVQCIYNLKDIETNPTCSGFLNKENFGYELNRTMIYLSKNPDMYERMINELIIKF